jgi:4-aminobutyrate aminotransferase-like enzyme
MLIVDEVQTGFGRTGKMFATEHFGVEPDIMLMAKGIANGMPIAAFITRKEIAEKWPEGRHGTTYGGNPLSCAASLATISVLEEERLVERAAKVGEQILDRLKKFARGKDYIGDVRGLGLMIAVEFNDKDGKPDGDLSTRISEKCFENKLLVMTCGSHGQVIRLIPSLNVSDKDLEKGLDILEKAITQ